MRPSPLALLLSLVAAAPVAADDPFLPDPATRYENWLLPSEELADLAAGDFDDDGREDVVLLGEQGSMALVLAPAERQWAQALELGGPAVTGVAVQRCDGRDRLLVASAAGLTQYRLEPDSTLSVGPPLPAGPTSRVLYARSASVWSVAWTVEASGDTVRPFLFDSATGDFLTDGPSIPAADVGATALVDLDGNGLAELGLTVPAGCAVTDTAGNLVATVFRAQSSDPDLDRLARLVDSDGTERLAWIESEVDAGTLHVLSEAGTESIALAGPAPGVLASARADADGLADLVLTTSDPAVGRVLHAQPGAPRYAPGTAGDVVFSLTHEDDPQTAAAAAALVALDADRDGDADLVGVRGEESVLVRGSLVDHESSRPGFDPSSSLVDLMANGGTIFGHVDLLPPAGTPAGQAIAYRFYAGEPTELLVARELAELASATETPETWPHRVSFSFPNDQGEPCIWFLEVELVDPAGALASPTLTLACVFEGLEQLEHETVAGGELWRIDLQSVLTSSFAQGTGTKGSTGVVNVPRLPPPEPPGSLPLGS